MSSNKDIYEIYTSNGLILEVDKNTNQIIFDKRKDGREVGKYTQEYSKALFEAHNIK
ncbi:hypothetical protein J4551_001892, partial [Campylobacter coli]|nr:hypothetical protein [Campylobacter coli]EHG4018579.1 hypothetical protein [Campylobacter coli]